MQRPAGSAAWTADLTVVFPPRSAPVISVPTMIGGIAGMNLTTTLEPQGFVGAVAIAGMFEYLVR